MEGPGARVVAVDDDVPPLARGDVQGVALPRVGEGPAVLGDDGLMHPVQVHRMDHHPFVHEPNAEFLAELRDEGLRRGKTLSVERVSVHAVIEDEHLVDIRIVVLAFLLRLRDERAKQSESGLLRRVVVGVYMCEPAFGTTNSYVNDWPGLTGGCVMNGTPSIAFGSSSPWK